MIQQLRINNQIRVPRINLIDENGNQVGVVETREALKMAQERNLDLVEVVPNQWPPVAKIMDFGKYQYQKTKKDKDEKPKKSKLKGVRIGFRTGLHDLKFKAHQTDSFLKKGHKVRIEMKLSGREKALADFAKEKLNEFLSLISEEYKIEQQLKKTPRGFVMMISKAS